jgi:hypothetical protein
MQNIIRIGLVCLVAATLTVGCATTQKQEHTTSEADYSIVTAEDQSLTFDGHSVTIEEFVQRIKDHTPSKHVIFRITPESKIRQETMEKIVKKLRGDGYTTELLRPSE